MGNVFSSLNTSSVATRPTPTWVGQPRLRLAALLQLRFIRRLFGTIPLLALLLMTTLQPSFAQSDARQLEEVDLVIFAAEKQDDLVQVAWQIGAPSNNWNFAVYRSDGRDFTAAEPVDAPIFSSTSTGSDVIHYSLSDDHNRVDAHYWLVALGSENNQQVFGPYDVQQRLALFLPLIFQNH